MSTKIICITGKAGSGKDTFAGLTAGHLRNNGERVLITHFADLVKFVCRHYFGWNGEKDEAGRTLLQHVGTDVVRHEYPRFWVDFILDMVDLFPDQWDYVIIPDCRFPNEFEAFGYAGYDAHLIRVLRPSMESALSTAQQQHSSETSMDDYPCEVNVVNEFTLDDLAAHVPVVLEQIGY